MGIMIGIQISLLAAFLGGLVSLLSPCSMMVIPTFAAASTKQRHSLFRVSLYFSFGLLSILLPLGLGIASINAFLVWNREFLSTLVGLVFLIVGLFMLTGVEVPFPDFRKHFLGNINGHGFYSIYVLGLVSGVGTSACIGPILGAILTLAASAASPVYSILLIITYGLGILLPLLIFSWSYDRTFKSRLTHFYARTVTIGSRETPLTHIFSGLLLLFIGYIFLIHKGDLSSVALFRNSRLLEYFFNLQDHIFTL